MGYPYYRMSLEQKLAIKRWLCRESFDTSKLSKSVCTSACSCARSMPDHVTYFLAAVPWFFVAECPEVSAAAGAQNRCWQRQRHPSKGWIAFSLVRSGLDSHQVFLACMGWIALAAEACLLEWANLCHTSASPVLQQMHRNGKMHAKVVPRCWQR